MILTKHLVELRKQLGVPFILISFDDKHNFFDKKISGQYTGTFDLCKHVDLFWTSSEITSSWAKSIGSKAVFIAEGANPEVYFPINCEKIYDVSFVGLNYGVREQFIKKLSKYNLRISCFGNNWNSSNSKYLSNSDINGIFNQSKINLGIGFASASNIITNLKGRDFEIPMAGGGIYLTSYNYDLAKFYNLNNEILCYNGIEDCVELIRFLLNNQSLREEISYNAYNRAYSQHKWEDRFCSAYNYIIAQAH
jgi:spore maturation protein CgeB